MTFQLQSVDLNACATGRMQLWHARQGEILPEVYTQDASPHMTWHRALFFLSEFSTP